jgi:hypothetical protein
MHHPNGALTLSLPFSNPRPPYLFSRWFARAIIPAFLKVYFFWSTCTHAIQIHIFKPTKSKKKRRPLDFFFLLYEKAIPSPPPYKSHSCSSLLFVLLPFTVLPPPLPPSFPPLLLFYPCPVSPHSSSIHAGKVGWDGCEG